MGVSDLQSSAALLLGLDQNTLLAILISLVVVVLVALFVFRGKGKKSKTFLLVGPCGSGKTSIFLQLRDGLDAGKMRSTHTSMKENDGTFIFHEEKNLPGKAPSPIRLVDLPGHYRLRPELRNYLPDCDGIVLVVDVQDYSQTAPIDEDDMRKKNIQDAAEILFEIMTSSFPAKSSAAVLIACNKTDLIDDGIVDASPTEQKIRKMLEAEIEQLRVTRSSFMAQTDGKTQSNVLGVEGEKFSFENTEVPVTFAMCSAKSAKLGAIIRHVRSGK